MCWRRCTREEALARVMPEKPIDEADADAPRFRKEQTMTTMRCDTCGRAFVAGELMYHYGDQMTLCDLCHRAEHKESSSGKEATMSTNNEVMEFGTGTEVACPVCGSAGLYAPSNSEQWKLRDGIFRRKCPNCKTPLAMYAKNYVAPPPPPENEPGIEKVAKAHRKTWEPDALVAAGQSIVGGVGILAWTLLNIAAKTTGFALRRVVRPSVGWVAHRYGGAAALFVLACLAWQYPSGATRVAGSVANGVVVAANAIGSAWAWCAGLVG